MRCKTGEEAPVDDVPADLDQNARESGERNRLDVGPETQQERQQEQREYRARRPGPPAGAYVGHRIHGSPGAGQSADEARERVADALAYEFPVRVVARAGERVGHQAGEQTHHRADERENERGLHGARQKSRRGQPQLQPRQAGRHLPDDGRVAQPQDAHERADDEPHEGSRQNFPEPLGPEDRNAEGDNANAEGARVDVAQRLWQRRNHAHRAAGHGGRTEKGQDLNRHHEHADAGHETRDDHVGRVGHEAAQLQYAQKRLEESAQHDHRQGFGEILRVVGDDDRHDDGHRRRGAGYLGRRAAEDRREKTHRYRAVQTRRSPHARRNAVGQRERQGHHHGGDAAEHIPAKRIKIVFQFHATMSLRVLLQALSW